MQTFWISLLHVFPRLNHVCNSARCLPKDFSFIQNIPDLAAHFRLIHSSLQPCLSAGSVSLFFLCSTQIFPLHPVPFLRFTLFIPLLVYVLVISYSRLLRSWPCHDPSRLVLRFAYCLTVSKVQNEYIHHLIWCCTNTYFTREMLLGRFFVQAPPEPRFRTCEQTYNLLGWRNR